MAVQPVHRTREQMLTEGLGERIPIETAGHFTLYTRTKSLPTRWIHDKRKGPESLPVATMTEQFGGWTVHAHDDSCTSPDPLEVFRWWVEQQRQT